MLWLKALHIFFVIAWFAGLFYLPRLFVYHAQAADAVSSERFKVMERKLYRGIMTPAMVAVVASGLALWLGFGIHGGWLYAKLVLVVLLLAYHFWMAKLMGDFASGANRRSHVFYRWVNELPAVLLAAIVILVVVKPF
jgi:putative membrane protein